MKIYIPRLQFNKTSAFHHSVTVRCSSFSQNGKAQPSSINGDMFVLGMGFVGQFFAADLKAKGWTVSGSCTSIDKKRKLEENGYQAYLFDANHPQPKVLEVVRNHTHLLVSIPPVVGLGDPMLQHKELIENVLRNGRLEWLVYLSSTSSCLLSLLQFLSLHETRVINRSYPANPATEHARARLAAEEQWLRLGKNLCIQAHVFRLGGIYGPGRSAVDTILKQEPLSKAQKARVSKSYTSQVHVADICQALHASILKPSSCKLVNIVDDDPAPRSEVFEYAQKLVEENFPNSRKQNDTPGRSELLTVAGARGEKRVSNSLLKKQLGVELIHPSYRSGLRSIIEGMTLVQNSPCS